MYSEPTPYTPLLALKSGLFWSKKLVHTIKVWFSSLDMSLLNRDHCKNPLSQHPYRSFPRRSS